MLFKGGTSLSKAYGLIDRFSEDIDLSLDRASLYGGDLADPEKATSKKKAQRLIDDLTAAAGTYVSTRLLPELADDFATVLGVVGALWELEVVLDAAGAPTLNFRYPAGLDAARYAEFTYLHPVVKIEMGIRSDHWPAGAISVRPYAAEHFPDAFLHPAHEVRVLAAERTFWEKVTLLHAEYHRPADSPPKENLSRHYYDVVRLAQSYVKDKALGRLDLLERVAAHKSLFFRSAWAHYDTATPGSLRLVPHEAWVDQLRRDYVGMREMIFVDPPSFDELMVVPKQLETGINMLTPA